MAAIDYYALEEEIKAILEATIDDVAFSIEDELQLQEGSGPIVGIYLTDREPAPNQYLSAGRRVDYHLSFSLWCFVYGLEKPAVIRARNDLVSRVEAALLGNPTINDKVERSWLEGGSLTTVRDKGNFASGGEIKLTAVANITVEG